MMKKISQVILIILVIIVTFLVQIYLLGDLKLFGVRPNLILVEVIIISMLKPKKVSITLSCVIGFFCDIIFEMRLGKNIIFYLIITLLILSFNNKYRKDSKMAIVCVTGIATLVFEFMQLIMYIFSEEDMINIFSFTKQVLIQELLNIGLAYIMCKVFNKSIIRKNSVEIGR